MAFMSRQLRKNKPVVVAPNFPSNKGLKNGSCNRSVCLAPGALYYNSSTRAYYCKECAYQINKWYLIDNPTKIGVDVLCTYEEPDESDEIQRARS